MPTSTIVCCLVQLISVLSVDGVTLSLNPLSMVIGSSTVNPTMSLNMQCSSSGTSDVDSLFQLKLSRRKFTETTFVGIASMKFDGLATFDSNVPSDIRNRSPNITGSVDTDLKSGTITLFMNAQSMTCTDQAEFQCTFIYSNTNEDILTVTDNKNFTVITVPSDVIIDSPEYYDVHGNTLQLSNNTVLNAGTRIKYRCTANVGSVPEGEIIWERSPEMGTMNLFIPYTPAQSTDIVQESSQQNGCFYKRTSTMYYNLTKFDEDGISFRCRARSYLNLQWYEALANQQYRVVAAPSGGTTRSTTQPVDGVTLTLNPPSMVIGSSTVNPSMSLIVQCFSSGTLDIDTLTQLKLSRRKFTESTFTGIASMKFDGLAKLDPTVPSDIQIRQPNITGSVDTEKTSGTMTLSINAQGLTCIDQAEFSCSLNYIDTNQFTQTVFDNENFTVITVPSEVIIDSSEYYDVSGNTLQLTNNSVLNAGTRIKFRCTANVGSVPDGEIIWERSPEMGSMNSFIPYTPAQPTDIVQESSQQSGCFYRRTSTMHYNLTKLDEDGISFRCRARSYLGGQFYEALANQQYRVVAAPSGETTGSTTQPASSGGTAGHNTQTGSNMNISTVVAIVLGLMVGFLVVVIVILSICLHRYRKLADVLSQEKMRAHNYDDLNKTTQSSGPYSVLNAIPSDLQSQEQSRANTYDRLNETRQSSEPYAVLNVSPSDGNVHRKEKPYGHMAQNVL